MNLPLCPAVGFGREDKEKEEKDEKEEKEEKKEEKTEGEKEKEKQKRRKKEEEKVGEWWSFLQNHLHPGCKEKPPLTHGKPTPVVDGAMLSTA